MRNKIFAIIALAGCMAVSAQETCIINGRIGDSQLADGKKVKVVQLARTNEFGQASVVVTAKVKKGAYTFEYTLAPGEPVLQYAITGFGDGKGIALFVEPGEVVVTTEAAIHPEKSTVVGTPTNDTYAAYQTIVAEGQGRVAQQVAELEALHGAAWLESAEGKQEVKRIQAQEAIKTEAEELRFLIDHNASPMTPMVIEQCQLPKLSEAYDEQMTKTIAVPLHEHPYYHSLRNTMLASTLKAGSEAPDITLPLLDGETKHLADYRGKHVILNFWNDAAQAAEMMTELQNVYELTRDQREGFVILSISLESDAAAWREAVKSLGIDREGWLHACDGAGINSPAAKRYGIEATPRIILIEPEGHAVSLDMELDELALRIEQILSGDLYYLDEVK